MTLKLRLKLEQKKSYFYLKNGIPKNKCKILGFFEKKSARVSISPGQKLERFALCKNSKRSNLVQGPMFQNFFFRNFLCLE